MVRQKILDINVKKMKMAQELMAVLSVMGITEEDIDELFSLINEVKTLREEVNELNEFKKSVTLQLRNTTSGGTTKKEDNENWIQKNFPPKVEEFNPYGRK